MDTVDEIQKQAQVFKEQMWHVLESDAVQGAKVKDAYNDFLDELDFLE